LLVAGLVCAAALPDRAPRFAECAAPVETGARGALVSVVCAPVALAGAPAAPTGRPVAPTGRPASLAGAPRLLFGLPLDLNRADAAALEAPPGIGPGRARAIERERAARPYCAIGELERVPGLGRGTVSRVAPFVSAACAGS